MMGDVTYSEVLTNDGGTRVPPAADRGTWSATDRLLVVLAVAWLILVPAFLAPLVLG